MKKLLLSLLLLLFISNVNAQNIYSFGFDGTTSEMINAGWSAINQSSPTYPTANKWNIPTAVPTNYFPTGGQAGGTFSFATVNYQSTGTSATAGSGTISNWLISPVITLENGNVISFYTRTGKATPTKADRMQLRMSTNGMFSTDPLLGAADVGDYTNLLVDVNPSLTVAGYPQNWTQYSYTVVGLSEPTTCRIAFRYFVTSGGPTGSKSDQIGIDTFSIDTTLATDSFFASNYSVGPNPAYDFININSKTNAIINLVEIADVNGRVVKNVSDSVSQVNVSDLRSGVYILKIKNENGVGTSKFVKE